MLSQSEVCLPSHCSRRSPLASRGGKPMDGGFPSCLLGLFFLFLRLQSGSSDVMYVREKLGDGGWGVLFTFFFNWLSALGIRKCRVCSHLLPLGLCAATSML